jgi:hypothetical protein
LNIPGRERGIFGEKKRTKKKIYILGLSRRLEIK